MRRHQSVPQQVVRQPNASQVVGELGGWRDEGWQPVPQPWNTGRMNEAMQNQKQHMGIDGGGQI
jgi:hypothetical protein